MFTNWVWPWKGQILQLNSKKVAEKYIMTFIIENSSVSKKLLKFNIQKFTGGFYYGSRRKKDARHTSGIYKI